MQITLQIFSYIYLLLRVKVLKYHQDVKNVIQLADLVVFSISDLFNNTNVFNEFNASSDIIVGGISPEWLTPAALAVASYR